MRKKYENEKIFKISWHDETKSKFTEIKHRMRKALVLGKWGFVMIVTVLNDENDKPKANKK